MKYSVYDAAQTGYRVKFACAFILAGRRDSRLFDTCFEMGDGSKVSARIYRRALKNPRLMESMSRYLDVARCRRDYEKEFLA